MNMIKALLTLGLLFGGSAWAGRLGDFEGSASGGSSNDSDDDDDSCVLCSILEAILTPDDDDDVAYPDHAKEYRDNFHSDYDASTSSASASPDTIRGLDGWEMQFRYGMGYWGEDFYGHTGEFMLGFHSFVFATDGTWDEERLGIAEPDKMWTQRVRIGMQLGKSYPWITGLVGVSTVEGEEIHSYLSTRLGMEFRKKYRGLRFNWDMEQAGKDKGFHDLLFAGYVKRGPIQLDLGYRVRITRAEDMSIIQGPQAGVTVRFGRWKKP
jgi:hypothetical protein